MKQNNYYIFGGQYETRCLGGAPTLIGAKRMATKHMEYWDNWQGWHKPKIYRAEDTVMIESKGRVLSEDGQKIRVPKDTAEPIE